MARVAGSEHFSVAQDLVLEAEGGLAKIREFGADAQLVVEEGALAVADERFHDDDAVALLLEILVGETCGAEPLDAADLEVGEVAGVVDDALSVGLGVADA